ncbi:MAG: hypothetical protein RIQ81_1328 [Pseudomonadota bacterium]|jgi:hypothetical protein
MATPQGKISVLSLLKLRCPYCGVTPLRSGTSWFNFAEGCPVCDYRFEREPGYFTGASWMVNYTASALFGLSMGAAIMVFLPDLDGLIVAAVVSLFLIGFGLWFIPYSMALWLGFDHLIHPLNPEERFRSFKNP